MSGLGLSSRKNLCCHDSIKHERFGKTVDARCRELTASFVRAGNEDGKSNCDFFNGYERGGKERPIPAGV
jgi:DNA excision repair protein ERCC-2